MPDTNAVDTESPNHASGTFTIGDKTVHRLGFGAMRLTGPGIWGEPADRAECVRVVRRAVELGVDLIDTADSYGPYVSEEIIREALHPYPEQVLVATKAGLVRHGPDVWLPVGRPEYLRQQVEMSLRRLGLDRIDLFQLHRIDPKVPAEDQIGELATLQEEGKIGSIGLSEVTTDEIDAARKVAEIATVQNMYNLSNRKSEDVVDYCTRESIGFIPWFPIDAGKLARDGGPVAKIVEATGSSAAQVALAWLLDRAQIILPIPGTSSVAHLEDNMGAARLRLTKEQVAELTGAADQGVTHTLERRGTTTSWTPVALVGIAFAITMLGATLPTPLYPLYSAEFGFGELVTTLIFATYAVGVVAGLLLFGHWSDQIGRRPLLLAGLVLSALSAAAFLIPGSLFWLFLGRLLSGFSAGIFTGTATATIVDLAPDRGRARAGLVAAAVNVGGLGLGPVLAGLLAQYAPWPTRLCFVVDLGLIAIAVVLVLLGPEPVTRSASPQLRPRRLSVPEQARGVFVRASLAGFAGFAVLGLITAVSPAFLGTVAHQHDKALVGAVVFLVFAASVVGQAATERLGLDGALQTGCAALIAGMVVLAVSLPLHSLTLLITGAVMAGFGHGTSFRAGLGSVAAASPEDRRGEVTSTLFVLLYIGISIPVVGVGALTAAFGLVTAGVVFAVAVSLVAAVALGLLVRAAGAEG